MYVQLVQHGFLVEHAHHALATCPLQLRTLPRLIHSFHVFLHRGTFHHHDHRHDRHLRPTCVLRLHTLPQLNHSSRESLCYGTSHRRDRHDHRHVHHRGHHGHHELLHLLER